MPAGGKLLQPPDLGTAAVAASQLSGAFPKPGAVIRKGSVLPCFVQHETESYFFERYEQEGRTRCLFTGLTFNADPA